MIDGYPGTATTIAAIGAAISGGVFFAFSTFVLQALGRLADDERIAAMNAINRAAPTPLFMLSLFGTGALCIALSAFALRRLDDTWALYVLIGSALYLTSVVVTVVYHVPRNNALLLVDPHGSDAARAWASYLGPWTLWNHVRIVTSLAGATFFILALRVGV